jgi:hypothetical protein
MAALYGLALSVITFATSNLADQGADFRLWMTYGRPGELIGYFGGQLLAAPLIFVLVAFIRNRFV